MPERDSSCLWMPPASVLYGDGVLVRSSAEALARLTYVKAVLPKRSTFSQILQSGMRNEDGRTNEMNAAYISALSALLGSAIGALASLATTWLTQRHQDEARQHAQEVARRERLFVEFIDLSSREP